MRRVAPLAMLLLLAACEKEAPSIPETDLLVRVEVGVREVLLGQAFPVTVTRVWEKDLEPSEWDDASLSPLIVRLEERTQRENDARVEETLRYRGYAFTLDDVRIPPVVMIARPLDGSPGRIVKTDALRLRVRPALDPVDPGDPELPGGLHAESRPGTRWLWGGVFLLLLLGGLTLVRARRPSDPPLPVVPDPTPETPATRALAALERIRARASGDVDARAEDVSDAAEVVRTYVSEAFGVPAPKRTSEELLAANPPTPLDALRVVLLEADRVKYATGRPSSETRGAVLDAATSYVARSGGEEA